MNNETKSLDFEFKKVNADGSFEGYGSIFGNVDLVGDVVAKGAFKKSLTKTGAKGVKLLWQHKWDEPIGVFTDISEDEKGLLVKGQLFLELQKGKEANILMKGGALDGLSIGYRIKERTWEDTKEGDSVRILKELDLHEVSLVTFPANPEATVSAVKSKIKDIKTIRELEEILRDCGFSQTQAKGIASKGFTALNRDDSKTDQREAEGLKELAQNLEKLKKTWSQ